MTTPDTKAIRAQMEPLDGFTPGPWLPHNQPGDWGLWGAHRIHVADASPYDWDQCIAQVEYQTPYCLGEKRSVIEAAKTAACNARLIAAAPDMRETILALCDALDGLCTESDQRIHYDEEFDTQYEVERNPCGAHMAIQDMQRTIEALAAENARLQTIIGNLHTVEEKHRETANAQFHRANRLQAENERLRNFIVDFSETKFDRIDRRSPDPQDDLDPLTDYLAIEAWQDDARAALAQKGASDV